MKFVIVLYNSHETVLPLFFSIEIMKKRNLLVKKEYWTNFNYKKLHNSSNIYLKRKFSYSVAYLTVTRQYSIYFTPQKLVKT